MKKRAERFGLSDEMARRAKRAKRFQTLPKVGRFAIPMRKVSL